MKTPLFFIKLFRFEYWASWVFYLPLIPYYGYLALKNRSFTFPVLANPALDMGGLLGNSKAEILQKINAQYLPKTLLIDNKTDFESLENKILATELTFPLIAKPDVGERGLNVAVIQSFSELKSYLDKASISFLVQELIDFPLEMGVFYSRLPQENRGKISSITLKEFLTVEGDGVLSIEQLMQKSTRARFQIEAMQKKMGEEMNLVLPKGEKRILEPIGNHCRGTKFIDGRHLINPKLEAVFDKIAGNLDGIYYGRFDLKVPSLEDLYAGKNIKILELNGINSEPTHIFDPNYKLLDAYRDVIWHWQRVAQIANDVRKTGKKALSLSEARQKAKQYFAYKKIATQ